MGRLKSLPAREQLAHPLNAGLIGAWLFNEGSGLMLYDASPSGAHVTVTCAFPPTNPSWVAGNNGAALHFGTGATNTYGQSTVAVPINPTNFSVAGWISPTAASAALGRLIEIGDWQAQYVLGIGNGGAGTGFHFGVNGSYTGNIGASVVGQWSHVVGTWAGAAGGTGTRSLYVDGLLGEAVSGVTTPAAASVKITMSAYDASLNGGYTCNSPISDLRIWNRTLSRDEVNWLRMLTGP